MVSFTNPPSPPLPSPPLPSPPLPRFSGLTAEDFVGVAVGVADVQRRVLELVSSETVLLGHSLESDLRALKVGLPDPAHSRRGGQPDRPAPVWLCRG